MNVLGNLLIEVAKIAVSLGVGASLDAWRERRRGEQDGRALVNLLFDALKVAVSLIIGASLGAWCERKRSKQDGRALAELRQGIGHDVLEALSQWSAQGQLTVERDERTGEILAVSGRGEK